MRHQDLESLRKRGFQYTKKRDLLRLIHEKVGSDWSPRQLRAVMKRRADLLLLTHGVKRKNGAPESSHPQFIQTSMLLDGWWEDYRMSMLAWDHDKKDDYPKWFAVCEYTGWYPRSSILNIDRMSRPESWRPLAFEQEVERSDASVRSGGQVTMVTKVLDRSDHLLHPIKVASEERRRKCGMKLWQTYNSHIPIARELGYMHEELVFLANTEQLRLGYRPGELDVLVRQPLDHP